MERVPHSYPAVSLLRTGLCLIAVTLGDPLVLLVHRWYPLAVPVSNPPLFWWKLVIYVLNSDDAEEIIVAE